MDGAGCSVMDGWTDGWMGCYIQCMHIHILALKENASDSEIGKICVPKLNRFPSCKFAAAKAHTQNTHRLGPCEQM